MPCKTVYLDHTFYRIIRFCQIVDIHRILYFIRILLSWKIWLGHVTFWSNFDRWGELNIYDVIGEEDEKQWTCNSDLSTLTDPSRFITPRPPLLEAKSSTTGHPLESSKQQGTFKCRVTPFPFLVRLINNNKILGGPL